MIHYWPQSLHCSAALRQAGQQEALLLRQAQLGLGVTEGTCQPEIIILVSEGRCDSQDDCG